jgi:hypothetical protein
MFLKNQISGLMKRQVLPFKVSGSQAVIGFIPNASGILSLKAGLYPAALISIDMIRLHGSKVTWHSFNVRLPNIGIGKKVATF